MRTLLLILVLALSAAYAQAQDPAAQAAQQASQQATQAAQQASQQAMQDMQTAQQAAQSQSQAMQNAAQNSPSFYGPGFSAKPKFSVKPGNYSAPVTVRIDDASRGAIIYYTTDGWTPTAKSTRYKGPITIDSTTTLQAVAVSPYAVRSFVASAQYTINAPAGASSAAAPSASQNPASAAVAPAIPADLKLVVTKGTPVPLVFAADVNSKTATVGDQIPLALADDLIVAGTVVVKKGSPAIATVIQVDRTGLGGLPGEVQFEVNSLDANGTTLKLCGSAAKDGEAKPPSAAALIPVVGPFTIFKRGTDAEIKQGALFIAHVAADTPLAPPAAN